MPRSGRGVSLPSLLVEAPTISLLLPETPSSSPSRVFISLLLQSAPLALPSSSYFFFLFIFHAAKANACIMRGTGLLAVLSESNDLRESGRVIDRQQKRAQELQRSRCLTLSFL